MNPLLGISLVLVLVGANAFFVAVEFALVAADRSKLEARAEEGSSSARSALNVMRRLSFHLSGAQLGITISSLVVGYLTKVLVQGTSVWANAIGLAAATVFQMVMGELIPKNFAVSRPEATATLLSPAAQIVHGALSPFIAFFNGAANKAVRLLGIEPTEELASMSTLDDLEYLIRSSGETGTLGPETLRLLTRTVRFGDKTAADALRPRTQVRSLDADSTVGELMDLARQTGHTRYPVYGNDVDDVRGVASITSVFDIAATERKAAPISQVTSDAVVIPETRDLVDVLDDFQESRASLLIVVDEHGGTAGILTLEDVLEEITGEIDDEYDASEVLTVGSAATGVYIVAGTLGPDEVQDASGLEIPEGEYETIAGFVLDRLGRVPQAGDGFRFGQWFIEVAEMDRLRIASLQLTDGVVASVGAGPGELSGKVTGEAPNPAEFQELRQGLRPTRATPSQQEAAP